jgi:hypothetical protein
MSRFIFIVSILSALVLPFRARAADEKSVYDPESFTISYWCGPPGKFNTLERYQEIKDANFTTAFPPSNGNSAAEAKKMLDFCQQVGLKAIISDTRMVYSIGNNEKSRAGLDAMIKEFSSHPALLGYHIVDEPGAGAYPGLAEVVAYLKQIDPKHVSYINLLPTYAGPMGVLGTKTYEEYVRQFADTVKPFVISYDHYHFINEADRKDFFENLSTVRKVSLETKIPFWNIVLATQLGSYVHVTEPQLRFNAMQTLAFGANGLLWFTYWMPVEIPVADGWKHSLINADGSRDPHYDMVKAINADLKAIGDVLAKAKSTAVFHHGPETTVTADHPTITATEGMLTIGMFEDREKKTLALVTNRDFNAAVKTAVKVKPAGANVERFDPAKKTWSTANNSDAGVALDIPAGGGVLLRW